MEERDFALERLSAQMARGDVVLFTGAGFSAGAANSAGERIPQGSELKRAIWHLIEPGSDPDEGSTLADTYAVALGQNRGRLTDLLNDRLHVAPDSLGDTHELWLSMPWKRAYTLNIDDLEVAASRKFDFPRNILPHSGLKPNLPSNIDGDLLYTHLNGTIDDVPDVTFSDPQYGQRHLQENPLYVQLAADLLAYTVVFVGTEIRESLFWQYIAMRDVRGTRGVKEMRPVSFLVTPTLPGDRKRMLASFNIRWVPATADEFAEKVLSHLGQPGRQGHRALKTMNPKSGEVILPKVADLSAETRESASEYLLGAEPTWSDIRSARAIERSFEKSVEGSTLQGCVVVAGTAGAGTSTALMRLALRAVAEGRDVRWLGANHDFDVHQLSRHLRKHQDDIMVFIDDADTFGRPIRDFVKDINSSLPHVTLVLGMRGSKVDRFLEQDPNNPIYREIQVPLLEDTDIELLLDALNNDNKLGALKQLPHAQRVDRVKRECGRELLVAMIEATSGVRFELKVAEEFDNLPPEQRLIYAAASISTDLRFGLTRDELLIASGDVSNTGLFALDRLLARRLLVAKGGSDIRIRHRRLAEVVVSRMRKSGEMRSPYFGLARAMAMRAQPGDWKSRPARLLTALIGHRRVGTTFSSDEAREFYSSLEDLLNGSYHYWLQRGGFELQYGNIRSAGNFLQQARAGGDHDYRVKTEWAYYLLKSAWEDPNATDSVQKVSEAKDILFTEFEQRGDSDVHIWHVYGSQILAWTRRAPFSPDERAEELEVAKRHMADACHAHPYARDLRELKEEIEREWLMTRVPPDKL
jgi:hypothetical protein